MRVLSHMPAVGRTAVAQTIAKRIVNPHAFETLDNNKRMAISGPC